MIKLHLKQNNQSDFKACLKVTNKIAEKWKTKSIVQILQLLFLLLLFHPPPPPPTPPKMD